MRVSSAFTRCFKSRFVTGFILVFAVCIITSSFTDHSDRDIKVKQMNLVIRQIGHLLLLQAGDSASRVMPVTEIKKGTFQLRFENDFIFNHDSLMALSKSFLPKTQFPSGYTVTVHDCATGGIIYGFQLNNNLPDILACKGRTQPAGCYIIEFTFPDYYENIIEQKAAIDQVTKADKLDPGEVDSKAGELQKSAAGNEMEPQTSTGNYSSINMIYVGILGLLGIALLIRRFGKFSKPLHVQNDESAIKVQNVEYAINPDPVVPGEPVPELPALGKFLFNAKDQQLLLGTEVINLTDKECKVLELLHQNFGELIPRETLMHEVWIKEGVITGRSLDMFVSKLRKKLTPDPELRITNVHGKGYKLEIPATQIV